MTQVTITIPSDELREILIALRDRHFALGQEQVKFATQPGLLEIVERQRARVEVAHNVLARAIGEASI